VLHTYYEVGETFDRLVWLGAWNIKGKYVVRQVQFRQGGELSVNACVLLRRNNFDPPLP